MLRRTLSLSKGKLLLVLICICITLIVMLAPSVKHYPMKVLAPVWPHNQSRNAESYSKSSFILKPDVGCESKLITIFVTSSPKNLEKRNSIRNSWAKEPAPDVQIIFLLGRYPGNDSFQSNITSESEEYNDILQGDFYDSYVLLSVKSLLMLQWFLEYCTKSSFLMKTDDDVYINTRNLLDLAKKRPDKDLMVGSLICNAIPIHDPYNKYYAPRFMFNARKYPPYLSGTGYLLSNSVAQKFITLPSKTLYFI
uniref:Hexosyltransferase n=1 Tax=Caligus rogercresseyi TaxID=217165 RepID=C1BQZ3_CALRO|nr:Beta-1,3-galactosyltransferase 5 [Caligus rogercresseyi]